MSRPELHRGRLAKHPRILSVRSLTRDDLACLREKRVGPPRVKVLRRAHHRVARLIALGYRDHDIARMTGYAASRIVQLKMDPAVQELVAQYDKKVEAEWLDKVDQIHEEMVEVKLRGLNLIQDRLDAAEDPNDPQPIPLKDLLALTADMADRTGHGKKSIVRNEKVDFAAMMKEIARKSGRSNVIDATPSRVVSAPREVPILPDHSPAEQPSSDVVGFRRRV